MLGMRGRLLAAFLLLAATPVAAQWQVLENSVPVGRGAGFTGFQDGGTYFSVKAYGAVGDNSTDDAVAFQAAIDAACAAQARTLHVPSPTTAYKITTKLNLCSQLEIVGDNLAKITFTGTGTNAGFALPFTGQQVVIRGLEIRGSSLANTCGILFSGSGGVGTTKAVIKENYFTFWGDAATASGAAICVTADSPSMTISNNVFNNPGSAFLTSGSGATDALDMHDNYIVSATGKCTQMTASSGAGTMQIRHNVCTATGGFRFDVGASGVVYLTDNEYELGATTTNANSAGFDLVSGIFHANGNQCVLSSHANYCFVVDNSVVLSRFVNNYVGSFSTKGFLVGTGATNTYSNNIALPGSSAANVYSNAAYAGSNVINNNLTVNATVYAGSTSGTLTVKSAAVAGTNTLTWPAGTTDFSATGGTSQVVKQTSAGGAFTVAQLAASDLSNGTTGTTTVVLSNTPTLTTPVLGSFTGTNGTLTPTGTGTGLQINRIGSGSTAGSYWQFGLQDPTGTDGVIFAYAGSAYQPNGIFEWVGNSEAWIYYPSTLRIGTGTGTQAALSFYSNLGSGFGGHIRTEGTAPALTSCGSSPAIAGTDTAGTVTMGTGTPTGCVITFATAYSAAPHCVVTWQATPLATQSYTVSTTAITLTQTATSSNLVNYNCIARSGG